VLLNSNIAASLELNNAGKTFEGEIILPEGVIILLLLLS